MCIQRLLIIFFLLALNSFAQDVSDADKDRLRALREQRRPETEERHQQYKLRQKARLEKRRQERAERRLEKERAGKELIEKYLPKEKSQEQSDSPE